MMIMMMMMMMMMQKGAYEEKPSRKQSDQSGNTSLKGGQISGLSQTFRTRFNFQ